MNEKKTEETTKRVGTTITEAEHKKFRYYCFDRSIQMSDFLAEKIREVIK